MDERLGAGEVITERTPHGVRFVFPRRLGSWRVRDWVGTLVLTVVLAAFAGAFWASALLSSGQERALQIGFASLVTLCILGGLGLLMWWSCGHNEIAVEGGELVARAGAGLCVRVQRLPLRRLRRLEITTRLFWFAPEGGQESTARNQRELRYALRGDFTLHGPATLANGYPREMLEPVAAALADLAGQARADAGPSPPAIEIHFDQDREPPRPDARHVQVTEDGNTLRFDFPPSGQVGCAIVFGVLFAGVPGTAVALSLYSHGVQTVEEAIGLVCAGLFTVFGLLVLAGALLGRKRPAGFLKVTAGTVRAAEPGLWKLRERTWQREELAAVRNIRDSDGGTWLQLDLADGRRESLFAGVPGLDWVAWRLRQALQLPEVPP